MDGLVDSSKEAEVLTAGGIADRTPKLPANQNRPVRDGDATTSHAPRFSPALPQKPLRLPGFLGVHSEVIAFAAAPEPPKCALAPCFSSAVRGAW